MGCKILACKEVLVVSNMYPTVDSPYFGVFVKEQVDVLKKHVGVKLYFKRNKSRYLFSHFSFMIGLFFHLLFNRYSVIHVHYGLTAFYLLPLLFVLKLRKTKLVITLHGSDLLGSNWFVPKFTSWVIKYFDSVIAVSKEIESKSKELVGQEKTFWLPCGIDDSFFDVSNSFIESNEKPSYIVFPSSPLRPEKDFQRFLKILSLIGPEVNYKCLAGMNRDEVRECLSRANCLLMTSKYEGSPQTVKEALALGTPVISTPVGDVPLILSTFVYSVTASDNQILAGSVKNVILNLSRESPNESFVIQYKQTNVIKALLKIYEI